MSISLFRVSAGAALLAATAVLASAAPASALAIYQFSGNFQEGNFVPPNASFTLTPSPVTGPDQTFSASQVNLQCGDAFVTCNSVTFSTDFSPGFDSIAINFTTGSGDQSVYYYFSPKAFGVDGVYNQDAGAFFNNATLTVAGVPEPATWAMMIAGSGLAGAALRRSKKDRRSMLAGAA